MFCAYTRPRYQVSVYRTIGPLVFLPTGTDGSWSAWNEWSSCSVTCGTGTQLRNRSCDDPAPDAGGLNCTGDSEESMNCTISDYCLPSFYGNTLLVSTHLTHLNSKRRAHRKI